MFIGASLFAVLLVVAISAMTALILAAFKDTRAAQASVLADDEGRVMQTVEASTPLPLVAAPVLRKDQLLSIKTLSVKTADPEQRDREMKASFAIASVHWYNSPRCGSGKTHDEIRVWNGEATLVTADGAVLPLRGRRHVLRLHGRRCRGRRDRRRAGEGALIGAGFGDVAARSRAAASRCRALPPPAPPLPPCRRLTPLGPVRCRSATRSNEFIRGAPAAGAGLPAERARRRAAAPAAVAEPADAAPPAAVAAAPPPVVMTAVSWGEAGDGTGGGVDSRAPR